MTIGDILDRLSILEKRMEVYVENRSCGCDASQTCQDDEVYKDMKGQKLFLLEEFARILSDALKGYRPATLKKNKFYDKDVHGEQLFNFFDAIAELNKQNRALWDLEDKRRDLKNSDKVRLEAMDQISKHNKLRNDAIDNVDQILDDLINMKKE